MKIPVVHFKDAFENVPIIQLEPEELDGNIMRNELEILAKIIVNIQPSTAFEIGTFDGRSTINIAANTTNNTKVYTLDLPEKELHSIQYPLFISPETNRDDSRYIKKAQSGSRFKDTKYESSIVQLYGDSAKFNFSIYRGLMDFVFVDGSHAKDYVKNDTEVAMKLVSKKGFILWHDYTNWPDVTAVLNDYYNNDHRFNNIKRIDGTTFVFLQF